MIKSTFYSSVSIVASIVGTTVEQWPNLVNVRSESKAGCGDVSKAVTSLSTRRRRVSKMMTGLAAARPHHQRLEWRNVRWPSAQRSTLKTNKLSLLQEQSSEWLWHLPCCVMVITRLIEIFKILFSSIFRWLHNDLLHKHFRSRKLSTYKLPITHNSKLEKCTIICKWKSTLIPAVHSLCKLIADATNSLSRY